MSSVPLCSGTIKNDLTPSACVNETPLETVSAKIYKLKETSKSKKTHDLKWRKSQLKAILKMMKEMGPAIEEALRLDLNRNDFDAGICDIKAVTDTCKFALKNIHKWTKPNYVTGQIKIRQYPCRAYTMQEPLGVVCIIGCWNVPFSLTIGVAISAIAAGNCVLMKPSEITHNSANLIEEMVTKYLDNDAIECVNGYKEVSQEMLHSGKFDHVFFTGSETVGKIIYEMAAKTMTPCTLELGGKSPVLIDDTANMDVSARRILWGVELNAGQVCVSPDYILVTKSASDKFYEAMKKAYNQFYPEMDQYGRNAPNKELYTRIVNEHHTRRLLGFLEEDESKRGEILVGGVVDEADRYISPTILINTCPTAKVMQEEVFGPILPVLEISSVEEGIEFINDRSKPLTGYIFSKNRQNIDKFLKETSSGSVAINDVIMTYGEDALPFGGVGASGMGRCHGHAGFKNFSNEKSVLHKSALSISDPSFRYPPSSKFKRWLAEKIM